MASGLLVSEVRLQMWEYFGKDVLLRMMTCIVKEVGIYHRRRPYESLLIPASCMWLPIFHFVIRHRGEESFDQGRLAVYVGVKQSKEQS